ncbi:TPA: phage tail protein [Serratia marcescens]|nr:phage tail protein [Serratia marcescens]
MVKHSLIRTAVTNALAAHLSDTVTFFDGHPGVLQESDFPAIAVYLTDAQHTGNYIDTDHWQAVLHIGLFLGAQVPDSELDAWMETHIYPRLNDVPGLAELIETMTPQGYDYQRDEEMAAWSSADLSYLITYYM